MDTNTSTTQVSADGGFDIPSGIQVEDGVRPETQGGQADASAGGTGFVEQSDRQEAQAPPITSEVEFDEAAIRAALDGAGDKDGFVESAVENLENLPEEQKSEAAVQIAVAAGVAAGLGAAAISSESAKKIAEASGADAGVIQEAASTVESAVETTVDSAKEAVSDGASDLTSGLTDMSDASVDAAVEAGTAKLEQGDLMGGLLAAVSEQISDLNALHAHEPILKGMASFGKGAAKTGAAFAVGALGIAGAKNMITQSREDRIKMAEDVKSRVCSSTPSRSSSFGLSR